MAIHGKKYKAVKAKVKPEVYALPAAIEFLKGNHPAQFDETMEVAFRLGVDTAKSDQGVRGTVSLPHGTGKTQRVIVFAAGPAADAAIAAGADEVGYEASVLAAVESVNNRQKHVLFNKIKAHFGELRGKTIAVWGLAFKPNTDDMREAASRVLMESLWSAGATVRAYDPVAMAECERIYGRREDLVL